MSVENKNSLALPIAIVVAGALVAGTMFYTNNSAKTAEEAKNTKPTVAFSVAPVTPADSIQGNANADVTIIEYSDTECPVCKAFHPITTQVIQNYTADGKVALVYRYFPLDGLHKKARKEAQAVECAKQQGGNDAFWKYVNQVFTRTGSNDKLPETELTKIAKDTGLDVTKWTACYTSGATAQVVVDQQKTGIDAGVQGTPNMFFVLKNKLSKDAEAALYAKFLPLEQKWNTEVIAISDDHKTIRVASMLSYDMMSFIINTALGKK